MVAVPALAYGLVGIGHAADKAPPPTSSALLDLSAALQARIAGEVIGRQHPQFDELRRTDNRAYDRYPLLIARCTGTGDVVRVLDFARTRGIPVAIRGGGHSQAGLSSCDGGVVIDLGKMDQVTFDVDRGFVTCGAGARAWQADEVAARNGYSLPLGTCGDVGVSGLTLGGGFGFLLGTAGAACDALIGAQIVLADGRVRNVADGENADLMWAIRGAGANFGVVTKLVYRAVRLDEVFAGSLIYPAAAARDVLGMTDRLSSTLPDELGTFTFIRHSPDGQAHVKVEACWSGKLAQGREVINQFLGSAVRPASDTLRETTLSAIVGREKPNPSAYCTRYGMAAGELPKEALDLLADNRDAPPVTRLTFLDPIHGAFTRVKSDAMAFPHSPAGAGVGFILMWDDPKLTAGARAWADKNWAPLQQHIRAPYLNMLEHEGEAGVRESYGANYPRLRKLKAKYDPDNIFRSNQNILPA
jgi:FAD/FMN-containing dehydrogenase